MHWHPVTMDEVERMGGNCAICWGSIGYHGAEGLVDQHDYDHDGYSRFDKRGTHDYKNYHNKHFKHDRGRHLGWYKKPYGLYKKHYDWHRKPYYGYRDHGYSYFDNDGWELILRLSDDF